MSKNTEIPKLMGFLGEYNSSETYETKGFPKSVWPVLDEYFARYRTEFEQTDEEFNEKFKKTMEGLDSISLLPFADMPGSGVYFPREKRIAVDLSCVDNNTMTLQEILFHELNHAGEGEMGKWNYTGFSNYDEKTEKMYGVGLNEIITEMKSSRITNNNRVEMYNKDKAGDKYIINTPGYGNMIFAGSLMHHGLGIGEKEFLKATDKGAWEFDEQMAKQFATYEDYLYYRDSMTTSMDVMHEILYARSGEPTQDSVDNLLIQANNLTVTSMWAANQIISNQILTGDYSRIKDFSQKWRYHINGIAANDKRGLDTVMDYVSRVGFTPEMVSKEELEQKAALVKDTQIKILGIEAIIGSNISEGEQKELLSMLVSDEALDENVLKQVYDRCGLEMGESIVDMYKAGTDKDKINEMLKEEYGTDEWDNSKLNKDAKVAMKRGKVTFFDKVKDKVKKGFDKVFGVYSKSDSLALAAPSEDAPTVPEEDHMQLDKSTEDIDRNVDSARRYVELNERLDRLKVEPLMERSAEIGGDMAI